VNDAVLHARLLGPMDLRFGQQQLPPLDSARAEPMFAYLLLHRDAPQPRQRDALAVQPAASHLGRRSPGQIVASAPGVLVAGFVLYHNVWPVWPAPYEFFPYLVLAWLVAGLVITAVIRRFSAKVEDGLERVAES
jgi:hypothetical protein